MGFPERAERFRRLGGMSGFQAHTHQRRDIFAVQLQDVLYGLIEIRTWTEPGEEGRVDTRIRDLEVGRGMPGEQVKDFGGDCRSVKDQTGWQAGGANAAQPFRPGWMERRVAEPGEGDPAAKLSQDLENPVENLEGHDSLRTAQLLPRAHRAVFGAVVGQLHIGA